MTGRPAVRTDTCRNRRDPVKFRQCPLTSDTVVTTPYLGARSPHVFRHNRACRRPAAPATLLGHPDHRARHHPGRGRRRHRQCRAADHCQGPQREPGVLDLDRQRLPVGDHDLAVAAVLARRDRRLSTNLSGGARAVHPRFRLLRALAYALAVDGRTHRAGIWRGRRS